MTKEPAKQLGDLLVDESEMRKSAKTQTRQLTKLLLLARDAKVGAFLRQNGVVVKFDNTSAEAMLAEIAESIRKAILRLNGKKGGRPRGQPPLRSKHVWIDEVVLWTTGYEIAGFRRAAAIRKAIEIVNPECIQQLRGIQRRNKIQKLQKSVENLIDAEKRTSVREGGLPGFFMRYVMENLSE